MNEDKHAAQAWTAAQIAEDLLAQVDELLGEQLPGPAIARALEAEGMTQETAEAVVAEVRGARAEVADDAQIVCGVETAQLRRFVRLPGSSLQPDADRMAELRIALTARGLGAATAAALVSEVAAGQSRLGDVFSRRLRRVAMQGMIAGAVFTLFFAWTTLASWPASRWHLLTVAATAGMTVYSALLYRRQS